MVCYPPVRWEELVSRPNISCANHVKNPMNRPKNKPTAKAFPNHQSTCADRRSALKLRFQTLPMRSLTNEPSAKQIMIQREFATRRGQRRSRFLVGASPGTCEVSIGMGLDMTLQVHEIIWRITVELTRRRASKRPPLNQSSYETRSRRSRPTICYATHSRTPGATSKEFAYSM